MNTKDQISKTQDSPETNQDKNYTDEPLTVESFRRICQELLKDFPSVRKTGSVIIPMPWRSRYQ